MVLGSELGDHMFMPMGDSECVFTIQYMCVLCADYHVPYFFVTPGPCTPHLNWPVVVHQKIEKKKHFDEVHF